MTVRQIASVCHEANKMYCISIGDFTQPHWEGVPRWRQLLIMSGVQLHLDHPDVTPEQSHRNWMVEMHEAGWAYGPQKIEEAKLHPCMVPYADLPDEQKVKDLLFKAIVDVLKSA